MAENNLSLMNELAECVTKNLEPLTRILEENNGGFWHDGGYLTMPN